MTPRILAVTGLALLAACDEPMIPDSDVIRLAPDPAYTYAPLGGVMPTSCRADRPSRYTSMPSSCQRDMVLARQVTNPGDLVDPVVPGPPAAGPIGQAADAYISNGRTPIEQGADPLPADSRGRLLNPATAANGNPF